MIHIALDELSLHLRNTRMSVMLIQVKIVKFIAS